MLSVSRHRFCLGHSYHFLMSRLSWILSRGSDHRDPCGITRRAAPGGEEIAVAQHRGVTDQSESPGRDSCSVRCCSEEEPEVAPRRGHELNGSEIVAFAATLPPSPMRGGDTYAIALRERIDWYTLFFFPLFSPPGDFFSAAAVLSPLLAPRLDERLSKRALSVCMHFLPTGQPLHAT